MLMLSKSKITINNINDVHTQFGYHLLEAQQEKRKAYITKAIDYMSELERDCLEEDAIEAFATGEQPYDMSHNFNIDDASQLQHFFNHLKDFYVDRNFCFSCAGKGEREEIVKGTSGETASFECTTCNGKGWVDKMDYNHSETVDRLEKAREVILQ